MIPDKTECGALYRTALDRGLSADIRGWHHEEPIFERLVRLVRPLVYIEVGSYKGASLKRTADLMLDVMEPYPISCFAVDFWQEPGLYDQFLTNMAASGLAGYVTPIKAHSADAARALAKVGIVADLIYLDADHTYLGALSDMHSYYPLLREGGVMFGDDYTEEKGVARAVTEFGKPFSNTYYHWELQPKRLDE